MTQIHIGAKIRTRRLELHITQERLAEDSNSSINFISQLERGEKKNISLRKQEEIASALHITVIQLLNYGADKHVELTIQNSHLNHLPNTKQLFKYLLSLDTDDAESLSKSILDLLKH